MWKNRVSALNKGKEKKSEFSCSLHARPSCYKPLSSPITSRSDLQLFSSSSLFSVLLFFYHFTLSSILTASITPLYPSFTLSLFVKVQHEHHYIMFKHLRNKETYLEVLLSDVQEHEKAFTVGLKCQKAIKQSKTLNTLGNVSMSDQTNGT